MGSPGESLWPGAAAAFNAMSKAYERRHGHHVCVTDSYRSLAEQVSVKANTGKWAATPGTQPPRPRPRGRPVRRGAELRDRAHLWMRQNAPLYGWYHPAWAERGRVAARAVALGVRRLSPERLAQPRTRRCT